VANKFVIAATEHVSAISQDLGGDTVVVTFNEMGFVRNGTQFWGDEFLLKLGVSAIGIVTPRPNWYPPRDMEQIIPAVLSQIAGRRVITYGHSQGGFGAMKFSARLNADIALCFCPQWTIDPKDVGSFDTRTTLYFDAKLGNGVRMLPSDVCKHSFMFFDPREPADARHAAILAKFDGVRPVLVPFAMHDTIRVLTEGRGASAMINLCRTATPPTVRDFRRIIRQSRKGSKTYDDHMIRCLILRMSHSRRSSSLFLSRVFARTGQSSHFYSALIANAHGDANRAVAELASCTARDFEKTDLLFLWSLTESLNFFDAELTLARHIPRLEPLNTWACLHAVKTLIRAGHLQLAEAELTRISMNPDAGEHASYFAEFSQAIKKAAAAANMSAA
jgi:pimeloyl-ACP methyl ester carboxylesterase